MWSYHISKVGSLVFPTSFSNQAWDIQHMRLPSYNYPTETPSIQHKYGEIFLAVTQCIWYQIRILALVVLLLMNVWLQVKWYILSTMLSQRSCDRDNILESTEQAVIATIKVEMKTKGNNWNYSRKIRIEMMKIFDARCAMITRSAWGYTPHPPAQ